MTNTQQMTQEEIFQQIVDRLNGTTNSLDTIAEEYDMDPMVTPGLPEFVDQEIFCCTQCGWWCPQDEEASEDAGLDEWTCRDCVDGC